MTDITNEKPPIPAGFHERLGYNADFRLDWHDPDEATDGYQLKWLGKDYARLQAGTAPATVIVPDAEHNALPENAASGNIFLTGDNLEVLKHLQNAYSGSVDMIYIDPPYNTGKEFVYSDKFDFTDDQLKDMLGMTDNEIKRLHTINGRSSHSAWLTFMYPRLKIAQKLLKDTGVIFISIDDNEQANLKLLCDEVLNEGKFVNTIIWQKSMGGGTSPTIISGHDYILVYQKQKRMLFGNDFVPNPNDVRIINGLEYFIDKNPIHKEHGIRGTNEERYVYYEDLKPEEKEK
jgi:adenine specific DNA methylase Mod